MAASEKQSLNVVPNPKEISNPHLGTILPNPMVNPTPPKVVEFRRPLLHTIRLTKQRIKAITVEAPFEFSRMETSHVKIKQSCNPSYTSIQTQASLFFIKTAYCSLR